MTISATHSCCVRKPRFPIFARNKKHTNLSYACVIVVSYHAFDVIVLYIIKNK